MTISDISIKNPVFAWVLMFGLLLFGFIGFSKMGISQLPDVDYPVVTVTINWPGASPLTMETAVADIIEDALMTVEGILNIKSVSAEGVTAITIDFGLDKDINVALQEVQSKILQAQRNLPTDIDPAVITKSNPEDQPIMFTALYGSNDRRKMILYARDSLRDAVSTVEGVGDIRLGGFVDPNIRIWLDRNKMSRLELTVEDVISAVRGQHLLTPSGYIEDGYKESNVKVLSELEDAKEFSELQIPSRRGESIFLPIKIKDVGYVEEGLADIRRIARFNGELTINIGVIKQRGSNAVSVSKEVRKKIEALQDIIPKEMNLGVIWDTTKFIEDSTKELYFNLILSVILTSIVCWFFLGTFSSALNVIIAIPVSLVGSFIFLNLFGFTLNTFTLLALSLSIGIVVDDAIMVLENIVRHFESGKSRVEAAILGAREITPPAIAATLAILAIFMPVLFMDGIIGKFFFQFGVAMSVAVALSLLEALTLAPMRCSQMLTHTKENRMSRFVDRIMERLSKRYLIILNYALGHRKKILIITTLVFLSSLAFLPGLRKEMVPPQDQSRFSVTVQLPFGSSLEYTDDVMKQAEAIFNSRPEIDRYLVNVGGGGGPGASNVNQATANITMKEPKDREIFAPFKKRPTQQQFMPFIRDELRKIPGVSRVTVLDLSLQGFSARRGYPIEFTVQGRNWEELGEYAKQIMDEMESSGLMSDIDTDYKPGMPEININPDRTKAGNVGVTIANIADTISATVSSLRVGKYTDEAGKRSDIRISLMDKYSKTEDDIKKIKLRNNYGELVSLSDVVTTDVAPSMFAITRYNRERAISVFANIMPGKSQSLALEYVKSAAAKILPEGYHVTFTGSSQAFSDSFNSLYMALILGIIVAYMVLASQFNSFLHPIIILLALPFSVTGAVFAIKITGISMNIYSMIGILLLMGIVKKNSILLVEFTNQSRENLKLSVNDALLHACPIRLRPIIMTSIATISAAVPPAFAFGAGGETVRPMAIVVIGGVFLSTILTLVIVPCAYSLMSRLEGVKRREELEEALALLGEGK